MTPETCGAGGEKTQMILVWVRAPGVVWESERFKNYGLASVLGYNLDKALRVLLGSQGVHTLSTVNIHVRARTGYYLEQACTKCTYKRHIVIKQEVDIHEARDKAIQKYM